MFEKLIEKLYLRQKDNLVYYDPYMNTKTAKFYEDKATDLFDKIICKVFYLDLNIDVSYLSEEDIRDIIRKVQYKENIIEIFRIRGDKFIILLFRIKAYLIAVSTASSKCVNLSFLVYP